MSEHGARYARLAAALNCVGYAGWAHDHRGHGLNPTPPVGLGHFADAHGWRAIVDDAWAVSSNRSAHAADKRIKRSHVEIEIRGDGRVLVVLIVGS